MTRTALICVAGAILLTGCPRRVLRFGPQGRLQSPQPVLEALAGRSRRLHALQTEARFSGTSKAGNGTTSGLLAAQRPASLRIELDDFFGNPAAVVATDGQRLGIYQASTHEFGIGAASPQNLARLLPFEVGPAEAVALLLGDPQPIGGDVTRFFVDEERFSYALVFEARADASSGGGVRRQRIDVDTESLEPTGVEVEGLGGYRAWFKDYSGQGAPRVPGKVEVESPSGKVSLTYRQTEVNPVLAPDLFQPVAPPGAKVVPLD